MLRTRTIDILRRVVAGVQSHQELGLRQNGVGPLEAAGQELRLKHLLAQML